MRLSQHFKWSIRGAGAVGLITGAVLLPLGVVLDEEGLFGGTVPDLLLMWVLAAVLVTALSAFLFSLPVAAARILGGLVQQPPLRLTVELGLAALLGLAMATLFSPRFINGSPEPAPWLFLLLGPAFAVLIARGLERLDRGDACAS